jgi:hypothetical protein
VDAPTADPLKPIFKLAFVALEATAMLPLKLPEDCGANVTEKEVVCPGLKVMGVFTPETLKPVPVAVMLEIVALDPPVFCTVSVWVWLFPISIPLNARFAGLAPSVAPVVPVVTPVPARAIVSGFSAPLFVNVRLPLADPVDCGLNATLKVAVCPAESVRGRFNLLTLKVALLAVTCVIVRSAPLVLVRVSESVWLLPVCTLPKLRLAGAAVRPDVCEFCCGELFAELNPWHPIMDAKAAKAIAKTKNLRAGKWLMFEF